MRGSITPPPCWPRRTCPSLRSREWWASGPRVTSPRCSIASRGRRPASTARGRSSTRRRGAARLRARWRKREAAMGCSERAVLEEAPLGHRRPAMDRDEGLVERLRQQEPGAAEALVAAYGDRVYRLAIRITGNSSDAEEVVQDALWAATRKIDTFRGTAAFGSWVYRIAANAAYQKRRGRRGRPG